MKICAWCQKSLDQVSQHPSHSQKTVISHGICPDCLRDFLGSDGLSLTDFLNQFHYPVFVVDGNRKTISANNNGLSELHKKPTSIVGKTLGNVFDCNNAPQGCGESIHCKGCVIKKTVTETYQTGKPFSKVPAYPDLNYITKENKIRFLISTQKKGGTVLLSIDEISTDPPAKN